MVGPWEKYAAAPADGPWAKYAQPLDPRPDPTDGMSGVDKFRAGMGKAFVDLARGAGQLVGAVSREDVEESRKLDSALMNTGAGVAGNLAGNVAMIAPTALLPGANTVVGAGVVGATAGLLAPSTSTKETLLNVGLGGAGGAGGQAVANKLPGFFQQQVANASAAQAQNAQKFQAAQAANRQGYVIPPADLEPGALSQTVSGLSGKIKTQQVASQRNQGVTDALTRKALGMPADAQLDTAALTAIRDAASQQGYAPVRAAGAVQADKQFIQTLDNIAATQQGAAKSFPGLADNGVPDLIAKLKQPVFDAADAVDATRVLRAAADKAYASGDKTLGRANKDAANALEDMLERHLSAIGQPDALKGFKDARQLIAKTYSVQSALNPETGSVAANKLAQQLAKGKPLSGELRTVAETATAFPKANQLLKEAPGAVSPLDWALAGSTAMASGNPLTLAMLGARPLARNALLSPAVQARAVQQGAPAPVSQAMQKLLENRLAQLLAVPVGTQAGLQLAQ